MPEGGSFAGEFKFPVLNQFPVVLIHPFVACSYQQASKQSRLGLSFNETTN
jgi:hypothetical protein